MSTTGADLEAYRQANEDLRHFSGMRNSVLGAFTAISGGLFALAVENLADKHRILFALSLFNIGISMACSILEWRINKVAKYYAKKVDDLAQYLGMSPIAIGSPPPTAIGDWLGSILPYLVYFGAAVMWVYVTLTSSRP